MTGREERRYLRALHLLRTLIAVFVTAAVSLFFCLVPYRLLLPAAGICARGEGEMRLHFLSVGQGDCTVVEFPDGDVLVVDAGDGSFLSNNEIVRYLRGLDFTALTLAVTHADSDHFGGMSELLRLFRVERVYLPVLAEQTSAYERFLAAVAQEGCEADTLVRYDVISRPSGAYAVCISPHAAEETDENQSSTVLYLSYGGVNVLLGADMPAERERLLAAEYALYEGIFDSGTFRVRLEETDLLKVSHHGSAGASDGAWLSLLSPAAAVISCGEGNPYRHPAGEALERLAEAGAQIYRTDELSHIVVTIRDGGYTFGTQQGGGA